MSEHYTKDTLECTVWCKKCSALTQHRVDDGRRGPCLVCMEKQRIQIEADRIRKGLEEEQKKGKERQNPTLF